MIIPIPSQQSFLLILSCGSRLELFHSSSILGYNFHSENLVGILVPGSYNCEHFLPWKISLPSQVLTLWSALRATYWTNILNNLECFFPVTYHSIFSETGEFHCIEQQKPCCVAYQLGNETQSGDVMEVYTQTQLKRC